jgi:hypothetical protein
MTVSSTGSSEGPAEPGDPARPNTARIYDYWLGGTDNFEADRKAAEAIRSVRPDVARQALDNKRFLTRAVTYVAGQGVRQFLDVGAGLPTSPVRHGDAAPQWRATHEAARAVVPDAAVAYLDYDPVAVQHSQRVLAAQGLGTPDLGTPGWAAVVATDGDLHEPEAILADPAVRSTGFDVSEPACVVMACVLHFVPAPVARDVVARFAGALAPGSYLIISVGYGTARAAAQFTNTYNAQDGSRIYSHSWAEITAWFEGLDLVPPGLADVTTWRPERPGDTRPGGDTMIAGGVGRRA